MADEEIGNAPIRLPEDIDDGDYFYGQSGPGIDAPLVRFRVEDFARVSDMADAVGLLAGSLDALADTLTDINEGTGG